MRTLKKSLALVLAIVLVVGVCVFNVAAFTDDEAITSDEAVAVLTGIGVIKGRDTGAFDPTATLTRAEAATIITRLKGQEDLQAKSYFDDMQGHWAESYVAYCAAEGIVVGVGDNKFDPDAKLTGNQWGKMLLVAMGFDPAETGLDKGDTWEVAVAKLVKDKKLKVGVETLDMDAPISREQTCVLAFNALPQSVSGEKTYVVEGVSFDNATDAAIYSFLLKNNDSKEHTIEVSTPTDSLQANFPSLAEDPTYEDEFGRPGYQWTYGEGADKEAIYTAVDAPSYSFTAKEDGTADLATINGKNALNLTGKAALTGTPVVLKNGADATGFVAGDVVEVYANKTTAETIVITHYDLATISNVTALKKSELEKLPEGDTSTMTIELTVANASKGRTVKVLDGAFADYDYKKGDFVLVALGKDAESKEVVLASQTAETVTGKINGKKGAQWALDGVLYNVAKNTIGEVAPKLSKESSSWALDAAGSLAAVVVPDDSATNSTDYAMIYNVAKIESASGNLNEDGKPDETTVSYHVYAVLPDGSKLSAPAWTDKDGKVDSKISSYNTGTLVVAYEMKDGAFKIVDGEYTVVKKTLTEDLTGSVIDANAFASKDTKYIIGAWDEAGTSLKVTVYTGHKNAKLAKDTTIEYVVNDNTDVLYVFATTGISAVDDTEPVPAVAVLADPDPMVSKDEDDNDVFTYSVVIDGVETELVSSQKLTELTEKGQIFKYETVNDVVENAAKVEVINKDTKQEIQYVKETQLIVDGKEYNLANAKVYGFDAETGDVVAGELEAGQKVVLIANSKNVVSYAFIIDPAPET